LPGAPKGTISLRPTNKGTVLLWDITEEKLIPRKLIGHKGEVHSVAFNPDGGRLVSASADRMVKIWDTTTGQELGTLYGHSGGVKRVVFYRDGWRLASASADQTVKVWNLSSVVPFTIPVEPYTVTSVAFSPDNHRVALAESGRTVQIWDKRVGPACFYFSQTHS
jgi:WD40 repeat protein